MKVKGLIVLTVLLIVGVIVWAKTSSKEKFSQAKDFPVGALVYTEINDLPEVIKLWNESKLKEKYEASQNFDEFRLSHLGIKLKERFSDLSNAVGFSVDLQTLNGLADKKAAAAIYDIGKLDIVFIAPMSETLFSATMFAQNSQNFVENELDDGTKFYVIEAEVDRNRQKQKVIFANIKGRFVLTTSEKLFIQTASLITAKSGKHSLYEEESFKTLSQKITPNLVSVWVNQEKLNEDYYFKRYWLMSSIEDLQNIRAGIFDLNLSENSLTERREILLKQPLNSGEISNSEAQDLIAKVPETVPFYRLQKVDEKSLGDTIYNILFDKKVVEKQKRNHSESWSYHDYHDYYGTDYYYLNSNFDKVIDETEDNEIIETKPFSGALVAETLNSANPAVILTAAAPKILEDPLFVEFRKSAIISLKDPSSFQANKFENSLVEALKNRLTVAGADFVWTTENDMRRLKIPLIGWDIVYRLKGNKLFISNSFEFLDSCLSTENKIQTDMNGATDFTVIRVANRKEIFDDVMSKLTDKESDFWTGNVAGFLDLMEDVKQIEVRRKKRGLLLSEEISIKY